jgi:glycerol kinase
MRLLPEISGCTTTVGTTDPALFGGAIPICGMAGDQQAATIGQACLSPGQTKATFGTGAFILSASGRRARSRQTVCLPPCWCRKAMCAPMRSRDRCSSRGA